MPRRPIDGKLSVCEPPVQGAARRDDREIRKHGVKAGICQPANAACFGVPESAQAVQGEDTTTLVPFWRFFDTISKDLDHGIIQAIVRAGKAAEAGRGLMLEDVRLLKLLYLIRYINYIKATVNNLTIFDDRRYGRRQRPPCVSR